MAITIIAFIWPCAAQAAMDLSPPPSPTDDAQISRLIDPFFASLRSGQTKKGIADYMGTNPMAAAKASEMDYVAVQTDGALAAYGRILECQLTQKNSSGSWAQTRLYLCQHEKYMTRWVFTVIKLGSTWQAATFRFDDKFTQDSTN